MSWIKPLSNYNQSFIDKPNQRTSVKTFRDIPDMQALMGLEWLSVLSIDTIVRFETWSFSPSANTAQWLLQIWRQGQARHEDE